MNRTFGVTATGKGHVCPLTQLPVGAHGKVVSVAGESEVRRRLLEMGFCNGVSVEVIRRAPWATPSNSVSAATTFPSAKSRPSM